MNWTVGDRVRERPRRGLDVVTSDAAKLEQMGRFMAYPRTGRIVAVEQRPNARGSKCTYLQVLWDGFKTPSRHGVARLERLETSNVE